MSIENFYKLIIADDQGIIRESVKFLIKPQKHIKVEDEAHSYSKLSSLLKEKEYDLLILDLNLGDKDGIHSVREISKEYEDLPILVLSMYPEEPYALQSIRSGAFGYLNKRTLQKDLLNAINTILKGDIYIHPSYISNLPSS